MTKEFPYYSTFSSVVKPIVSEDKDKYLALASLEEVRAFIPNIDTKSNHDLLPIAFNAFVVNRVNKNDDVIDTATALSIYKNFLYKQINAEHNRQHVVGVILTAGFSEFGTDKPLTEEQVITLTSPFNVTLGGVLWRVVDSNVSSKVEESNDPTSEYYLKVSASWELGFTGYEVVLLPADQKNIEAGLIVSEASDIELYRPSLKSLKGSGILEDGRRVYRKPSVNVVPLGIGITENPAAEVRGVAVKSDEAKSKNTEEIIQKLKNVDNAAAESTEALTRAIESISQNNISQVSNSNVKEERIIMLKINSIADLTDESLKQTTASAVTEFISSELVSKSKEWEAEKNKLTNSLAEAQKSAKDALDEYTKIQQTLKTLEATVETLNKEKAEREQVEKFNTRMNEVSVAYELDDEVRAAIVDEIKALASDEDFDKWKKKASVLLKAFAKKVKPESEKKHICDKCEKEHEGECETKASTEKENVVEAALDNAQKEKGGLPNSSTSDKKSLKETFASAFTLKEGFIVKM
jgi:hypothetical protein